MFKVKEPEGLTAAKLVSVESTLNDIPVGTTLIPMSMFKQLRGTRFFVLDDDEAPLDMSDTILQSQDGERYYSKRSVAERVMAYLKEKRKTNQMRMIQVCRKCKHIGWAFAINENTADCWAFKKQVNGLYEAFGKNVLLKFKCGKVSKMWRTNN